jgi:cytochrome P450
MSKLPPGPRLPSAVQAWLWTYRNREFRERAHRRYGPSFTARIGGLPAGVVTTDRDALRRLMTGDPSTKRHANDLLREALGDRSLLLLEPEEHLKRRKLLTPPFHGDRVREYAKLMERLIGRELDGWRVGESVQVIRMAQALTLDVILSAVLGIDDGRLRNRLRSLFDEMLALPATALVFYYPAFQRRRGWNRLAELYWRKRDELDRMLDEQIAATRADPDLDERRDILAMMVLARDEDGAALTDVDLRHELNTLVSAGHETTATAIAWGAELLAHNPEVQARARAAQQEGDQRYLDALAKEVLRIRTPVVAASRHLLEPFELGGRMLERDSVIIVDVWGVHLDPSVYPEPDRFRPERFLEPAPEYAFLPFGGGAHRCLGAALAQLEIRVVLGAIVERFELRPVRPRLARPVRRGIMMVPAGGGNVRIEPASAGREQPRLEPVAPTPV